MPIIEVIRKEPRILKTFPDDTTLVILPMTIDRVGRKVVDEKEVPIGIDSLDNAFKEYRPSIRFTTIVEEKVTEFFAELEFDSIESFMPESIQTKIPGKRNDIADLKNAIDLLNLIKEKWSLPRIKKAWNHPEQKVQIIDAILSLGDGIKQAGSQIQGIFRDGHTQVLEVLEEIFPELRPWFDSENGSLAGLLATETSNKYIAHLADIQSLFLDADTYEQILQIVQQRIIEAEWLRYEVMKGLYEQLRPLEAGYRQIQLFYVNSVVSNGKEHPPVKLFILNADVAAIKDQDSITLEAIKRFIRSRNDNLYSGDDVWNLVVPGLAPDAVRQALEQETSKWGMLLITSLADER